MRSRILFSSFFACMTAGELLVTAACAEEVEKKHKASKPTSISEKQLAALEKNVRAKPADASAHYLLGNAYVSIGKNSQAIVEYQQADALDPQGQAGEYARMALSRLIPPAAQNPQGVDAVTAPSATQQQESAQSRRNQAAQNEAIQRVMAERDARLAEINKETQTKLQMLNTQMQQDIANNGRARRSIRYGYYDPTALNDELKATNARDSEMIKRNADKRIEEVNRNYDEKLKALQ